MGSSQSRWADLTDLWLSGPCREEEGVGAQLSGVCLEGGRLQRFLDSGVTCKHCVSLPPPQHSLPAPQGGKHANNPHLVEDQRFPQQRLSRKARQKTNVFDPDYLAGTSPFAENDIYSRAASLQIRDGALGAGRRRMNPNTATKKFVRKR